MAISKKTEQLMASLERSHWDHLIVLADSLEDDGEVLLAAAYRWLAHQRLAPLRYADSWHWRKLGNTLLPLGHQLPISVLEVMLDLSPGVIGWAYNERPSMMECYRLAANCIVLALSLGKGPLAPDSQDRDKNS